MDTEQATQEYQTLFERARTRQMNERFVVNVETHEIRPRWFEVNPHTATEFEWAAADRVYLITLRDNPINPKRVVQIGATADATMVADYRERLLSGFYPTLDFRPIEFWITKQPERIFSKIGEVVPYVKEVGHTRALFTPTDDLVQLVLSQWAYWGGV